MQGGGQNPYPLDYSVYGIWTVCVCLSVVPQGDTWSAAIRQFNSASHWHISPASVSHDSYSSPLRASHKVSSAAEELSASLFA